MGPRGTPVVRVGTILVSSTQPANGIPMDITLAGQPTQHTKQQALPHAQGTLEEAPRNTPRGWADRCDPCPEQSPPGAYKVPTLGDRWEVANAPAP